MDRGVFADRRVTVDDAVRQQFRARADADVLADHAEGADLSPFADHGFRVDDRGIVDHWCSTAASMLASSMGVQREHQFGLAGGLAVDDGDGRDPTHVRARAQQIHFHVEAVAGDDRPAEFGLVDTGQNGV